MSVSCEVIERNESMILVAESKIAGRRIEEIESKEKKWPERKNK